jgi:phenylalanyl-tRNA synthetase alpha chain
MTITAVTKRLETILASPSSTEEKRVAGLGRKGILTECLRELGQLPPDERAKAGAELNKIKRWFNDELDKTERPLDKPLLDLTAPGVPPTIGSIHPISAAINRAVDIFSRLGFETIEGPEIVSDWDNFESLHFHPDHPARDTQDTMMVEGRPGWLLRTQTSAVQIPAIATRKPPIRFIVPGKTYRKESDATHVPMFHQLEGVIIDQQVSFADLKGLLEYFIAEYFGRPMRLRFRPHFFPFTEPSAEVDVEWIKPDGTKKWLELLGCGCIHPEVLQNAGLDAKRYQGVAFGLGLDRHAMLLYGINDIRELFLNKEEILSQSANLS